MEEEARRVKPEENLHVNNAAQLSSSWFISLDMIQ
jgi:hypothetical protein